MTLSQGQWVMKKTYSPDGTDHEIENGGGLPCGCLKQYPQHR